MFQSAKQVWDDAVVRNAAALAGVVAQLLAVLSLYGGVRAARLPRVVHARIIRVLRPAESALRRLIVIAARGVIAEPALEHTGRTERIVTGHTLPRQPASIMSFQLFDPRKRFSAQRVIYTTLIPRVSFIAPDAPFSPLSAQPQMSREPPLIMADSDRHISARRLALRLKAFTSALDDIPGHAKRLTRLQLKRETQKPPTFLSPLRPGKPPGHRTVPGHEIDDILAECHKYALGVLSEVQPNTS
jgi:hypothetical protein